MIMGRLYRSLEGTAAKMACFGSKTIKMKSNKWSSDLNDKTVGKKLFENTLSELN